MRLSIILATANRSTIIGRTLDSISAITCREDNSIQLVVIDQSFDDATYNLLLSYEDKLDIKYVHALKKGLSHSRNIGLGLIDGDVFCFGDDDCYYEIELLNSLIHIFDDGSLTFISSGVYIPDTLCLTSYTRYKEASPLTLLNISGRITSISVFIKKSSCVTGLRFNENLGLGAYYGSCEEFDFIYRLLELGVAGYYDPSLQVFHDNPDGYTKEKTYSYALGHGALTKILLSKVTVLSTFLAVIKIIKSLLKFPAEFVVSRKLYPKSYFRGFWTGFIKWKV